MFPVDEGVSTDGSGKPGETRQIWRGANLEPPVKPRIGWVSQLSSGSGIGGKMVRLFQDVCALFSQGSPICLRGLTAGIVMGEREQRTP